jgi:hypothetical protein
VSQDISRFPCETNVLVPSSHHLRHVRMKSTFPPTCPHKTLQGECFMMFPQTSKLPLELEVTPPLSLLPLKMKVPLPYSMAVTKSFLPLDVVQPPLLGSFSL